MIKVGNLVECRFFNTPEGKFYGEYWMGVVLSIDKGNDKPYTVSYYDSPISSIALHRKEIKRIVKKDWGNTA